MSSAPDALSVPAAAATASDDEPLLPFDCMQRNLGRWLPVSDVAGGRREARSVFAESAMRGCAGLAEMPGGLALCSFHMHAPHGMRFDGAEQPDATALSLTYPVAGGMSWRDSCGRHAHMGSEGAMHWGCGVADCQDSQLHPGTTRALELFGAPDIDTRRLLADMRKLAPEWLSGCVLRECWFEPTFHKHAGQLCAGVQIHVEDPAHYDHAAFKPWRLQALAFKALRQQAPDYPLWRDFPYEYELGKLPIDVISGSPLLREWVDDPKSTPAGLDALARADETAWARTRAPHLLY